MSETRPRVLVVDDDTHSRRVLSMILTRAGFEVQEAVDGIDGYGRLNDGQFEVVLTDFRMPRMDGLQLLEASRRMWPEVPVVLVSGDLSDLAEQAVQQGAYVCIPKPVDATQLLHIIHAAVQESSKLKARSR